MLTQRLRHRVTIQRKQEVRDTSTGYVTHAWVDYATKQPAEFLPGPGREFLAAEALRTQVQGRFLLRYSSATAGISAGDRVLWNGQVWAVKAPPLLDPSARREVTLMVSEDGTDGA